MSKSGTSPENFKARSGHATALIIPVVLFGLAFLLGSNIWKFKSPVGPPEIVPDWATTLVPVRQPKMVPETTIEGDTYRCTDCHEVMDEPEEPAETKGPLSQHQQIKLEHGINDRCFNCHNARNRDTFADNSGNPIPWDRPELLCAKCHGPVYRDWLHGVHGRSNGYWDTALGPMKRLLCVMCHDPHRPPFRRLKPAPPPRTLRMGKEPAPPARESELQNPLLIFRRMMAEGVEMAPPSEPASKPTSQPTSGEPDE